jgi:hypothetical protein
MVPNRITTYLLAVLIDQPHFLLSFHLLEQFRLSATVASAE